MLVTTEKMYHLEIRDHNEKMYNFLVTKNVYDLAHNDLSYAEKFLIMQKQKYPALFRNKSAINDETHDKKVLKLTDGSNTIELHVSNNIFERANNDSQFGIQLFNKYNKEILKQKSHCIGTNVSEDRANENRQFDNYDGSENNENMATCNTTGASRHHWSTEQTKLLLFLFHQLSKEKMTHNRLWNQISAGMKEKGYALTASQCSTKMDSLKKAYKKCCDHNRQTGNAPKKIEHYDILCEIFAKTPWMQPLSTVGSSKPLGHHLDEESSSSGSSKRGNINKDDYMTQLLQLKKQKLEIDKKYKEDKLAILKDIQKKL